jgi:glucose/arabinose dehydrogenase
MSLMPTQNKSCLAKAFFTGIGEVSWLSVLSMGYLYFGLGTGDDAGAPDNQGQDLSVLRGKIMRVDVETGDPATYTIPPSNPYVGNANARPEIWALGLRNPWSSSFDRQTGDFTSPTSGRARAKK